MRKILSIISILSLPLWAGLAIAAQLTPEASSNPAAPSEQKAAEPFAFADFTWLNGNSRQQYAVLDTKYFTPEISVDTNYSYNFNHPVDHTQVGSTVTGRSNEFQLQDLGFGGDFHTEHARARIMTQFGGYATMQPRNDQSPGRGQFDLTNAYRYLSEAYGGYHWNVWNGINLDAGIFMSYIGLFSFYNFENWAYQGSYVTDNTPFFFNGLRLQMFPTDKFKAEIWLINGWQSYGMYNEMPGLGYQFLWRPSGNWSYVFNGYFGADTQDSAGRFRMHSDNSVQYKYFDSPETVISKAAFSITGDIGCENGNGVRCIGSSDSTPNQSFLGLMAYNRLWFAKDTLGLTLGGGWIHNPGRYIVLLPPIQQNGVAYATNGQPGGVSGPQGGANAVTGSNYFPTGPGTNFGAWDTSITFDYMPDQFVTFRLEYVHRQSNVPYFAGPGGITSPDGWNTTQSATWQPDLRKSEDVVNGALLVRL
jgi:hypothetical protein